MSSRSSPYKKHLVIPDTQIKPGVPTNFLAWIGQYIVEKRPDVVVHLGDHWDMPSLSSYDSAGPRTAARRNRRGIVRRANGPLAHALSTASSAATRRL